MTTQPLVDQWQRQLNTIAGLEKYNVPGVGRSYPLLAVENGVSQLRCFYHPAEQTGPNQMVIGAPYAVIKVDADSFVLLQEIPQNAFALKPFAPVTHQVTEAQKPQIRQQVRALKAAYDTIARLYPNAPSGVAGKEFAQLLQAVTPAALWPYYEALAPEFMRWLRS